MIRIIIVDDHPLTREGLKNRISKAAGEMKVINEACNSDELMSQLEMEVPDIVILDITMPGKNGLDILKEIRQKYPDVKVLILSMQPEEQYAVRMIRAGALGYLSKDNVNLSVDVLKAIRTIATENRRYISQEVGNLLVQNIDNDGHDNHHVLSDREWQVFCEIATGRKVREIAEEMKITVQTVHTYKKRAMKKLNLKSDAELIRYAIEQNLIE